MLNNRFVNVDDFIEDVYMKRKENDFSHQL